MNFHALANMADLQDGFSQAFSVAGKKILLIQEQGQHFIIENRCPHMDAPLATGKVQNGEITCRAHGIAFCLQTGAAKGPLAGTLDKLVHFEVGYEGNKIGMLL